LQVVVATPGRLLSLCGETPASTLARQQKDKVLINMQQEDPSLNLPPVLSLRYDEVDGVDDDDYDEDKPAWPTWAVGVLFRGARCIQIASSASVR
jgi:hypothetical protein